MDVSMEEGLRAHMKNELRARMRSLRKTLPKEAHIERGQKICANLCELTPLQGATVLATFVPMRSEPLILDFVQTQLEQGVRIVAPRLISLSHSELELAELNTLDVSALSESELGFMEPPHGAPVLLDTEIAAVLVPALAVDEHGYRLGYGRGFYDRLLPRLEHAVRVAVVYDFQLVPEVPVTSLDVPVHWIVSDKRILEVKAKQPTL